MQEFDFFQEMLAEDLGKLLAPFMEDQLLVAPIHCTIIASNGAGFVLQYDARYVEGRLHGVESVIRSLKPLARAAPNEPTAQENAAANLPPASPNSQPRGANYEAMRSQLKASLAAMLSKE